MQKTINDAIIKVATINSTIRCKITIYGLRNTSCTPLDKSNLSGIISDFITKISSSPLTLSLLYLDNE